MKKNISVLIVLLLISSSVLTAEKDKVDKFKLGVSGGIGNLELVHAGAKVQYKQSELEFLFGILPIDILDNPELYTYSILYKHHIYGNSKHSSTKPWFVQAGFSIFHSDDSYNEEDSGTY